jgi:hypothetical protein
VPILPRKRKHGEKFPDRPALKSAEEILRLKEERVKEFLQLSIHEIEMLDAIAAGAVDRVTGRPIRNAATILSAIKLKLDHTISKPKQDVGLEGGVTITINTLAEKEEEPVG